MLYNKLQLINHNIKRTKRQKRSLLTSKIISDADKVILNSIYDKKLDLLFLQKQACINQIPVVNATIILPPKKD